MKQDFEPEDNCCNCHTKFGNGIEVGSLEHTKTVEGYRTGYKCQRCAMPPPPALRSELYYHFYHAPPLPSPPTKTKEKETWLKAWWEDKELRKIFYTLKAMRSYAATYGYDLKSLEKMKRRKMEALQW